MRSSRFLIAVLMLCGGLVAQWKIDGAYAAAAARSAATRSEFSGFPHIIGKWRATDTALTARQLELLGVDDYLRADFAAADGAPAISVYAGYYRNGDRATQHPPDICYPGAGWLKTSEGKTTYEIAGMEPLSIDETVFESTNGNKTLVAYWYALAGYSGADASWQKVVRLKRLLSGKGVTGVLKVQIALPVETNMQYTQERLAAFLADFLPVLEGYSPRDDEGSEDGGQS